MLNLGAITLAVAKILGRFKGKMSMGLAVVALALAGLLAYQGQQDLALDIAAGALVALGLIEASAAKEIKELKKAEEPPAPPTEPPAMGG
jgi:type IV secretory pathway VirB2 component (pilin)